MGVIQKYHTQLFFNVNSYNYTQIHKNIKKDVINMSSTLWERDSFINENIPFLFNKEIIEYDMKDAGFSLSREFKLLDPEILTKLGKLKKDRRKIEMGIIERDNKSYRDAKKEAFKYARQMFFEANDLEVQDIISIKKDAIITTKKCTHQEFGKYILFRPKNYYTSYIQLGKRLEFYYNPKQLDVKGISDDILKLHKDYILKFIKLYFHKMETENDETVIEFMNRFITRYKRKELEIGYYREFNHKSNFVLENNNTDTFMDYWEDSKDDIDISYNFHEILLKLIQIPL